MLLRSDAPFEGAAADEFARLLGPSSTNFEQADDRASRLQIAVDAFALRHQVAESLLRLLHVAVHHRVGASRWVELIDTPTKNIDVMTQTRSVLDAQDDGGTRLIRSVLVGLEDTSSVRFGSPGTPLEQEQSTEEPGSAADLVERAVAVHVSWINYAILLFTQKSPDLDSAHNKFKHGMGLRPQDDVLTTITSTPPNADGGIPISALTGEQAVQLFDGVTTEFLSRASRKHGLEVTQMAMKPVPTLVEAAAMAHTLGLLFHTAAVKHFADHQPREGRTIPPHPGLLIDGPLPGKQRPASSPFALRFPLTLPLRDGGSPDALLFWTSGDTQTLKFGERMRGVVIDDPVDDSEGTRCAVDEAFASGITKTNGDESAYAEDPDELNDAPGS